jgi:hypothetical protein
VPRPLFAYKGENKKEFLSLAVVSIMSGALDDAGDKVNSSKRVSHTAMAAKLRVQRETVTRRFALFCAPKTYRCNVCKVKPGRVETCATCKGTGEMLFWDEARRRRMSEKMKERAAAKNLKVHDKPMRSIQMVSRLFNRNGGPYRANLYSLRRDIAAKPDISAKSDRHTQHAELYAAAFGENLFDKTAAVNGYKAIPQWVFHVNLPLDDYGRLLVVFLLLKGIEDKRRGNPANWIQITDVEIARGIGCHVSTVERYKRELEKLGIIRWTPGAPIYDEHGKIVDREPQQIFWMPGRLLDEDRAAEEKDRLLRQMKHVHDAAAAARAKQIHATLLTEWTGKEHSVEAFWNELNRRMASADLSKRVRDALIPIYRE